ncbi:hypothetical protein BDY17DRAFT_307965 [Neohortaea acidophila]|uniref:Zn(2)-C6 fungal-type domain-containing protein n=1 Tax=Neohortaea acidophila TaxID=245834 RepID=A0A6A6Q3G4_9PEZI|nr:uncharacterized protein BDY17DRAFT_307965 [Neohortaea acidophila]KAF2486496.1 hypothetical protein BDY17DRAFT_307965 [Neohortaea acidophila]
MSTNGDTARQCDQQQPQCARCLLGKRLCEYTQGQRIFVLNDAGSHKTIYKKKDGEVADRERRAKASGEKVQATNSEDQQTAALILSKQPSSSALHQQSLLAYALDDQLSRRHKAGYMQDLASSSAASNIMDSCLRPSFLAYYIAWLTRRESMDDPRLTAAGRELYICALQETHSALASRRTALSDSTLAACQALAAYEALECPGGTLQAWEWHQAALGRLVRLRGPAAHVDGPAWQVFTGFRLYSILQAFDSGHDTFLAKPEWTDIPFSVHPKRKLDELLDIFALGPQVSRMGSTLSTLPPDQVVPTAFSMVDKLLLIIKKLQEFEQRLERDSEVPLYQERSLPLNPHHASEQPGDAEFIFPPIFWFADLDTALLLTLFWAMSAMRLQDRPADHISSAA